MACYKMLKWEFTIAQPHSGSFGTERQISAGNIMRNKKQGTIPNFRLSSNPTSLPCQWNELVTDLLNGLVNKREEGCGFYYAAYKKLGPPGYIEPPSTGKKKVHYQLKYENLPTV